MKKLSFVLVAVLGISLMAGCVDVVEALKGQKQNAQDIVNAGDATVTSLQVTADSLPPGPDKDAIQKKIDAAKKVIADANTYIATADQALTDFQNGQVPQSVVNAVTPLPYGGYILFALSGLAALKQKGVADKFKDAFTKVVTSWEKVGADLSPAEKEAVSLVQGDDVTALVHTTKANL